MRSHAGKITSTMKDADNIPEGISSIGENLTESGARILLSQNENLPDQLRQQDQELEALDCDDPNELGAWIRDFEVPVLVEILRASQDYFDRTFPDKAFMTQEGRESLANRIEEHSQTCERCRLKVALDLQWKEQVDFSFEQHRQALNPAVRTGNPY